MKATYVKGVVSAPCPGCGGALTSYERGNSRAEHGTIIRDGRHEYEGRRYDRTLYMLLRCAGCGRGGMAVIHDNGQVVDGTLSEFYPTVIDIAHLPEDVPLGIVQEFREAELAAAVGANRAASALFRSVLEKTLRANGYEKGPLAARIDEAAGDGVITEARRKRAHDDIRVLGNDVLHDDYRVVHDEEVDAARHYAQRVLEDLYDDRRTVEELLAAHSRTTDRGPQA